MAARSCGEKCAADVAHDVRAASAPLRSLSQCPPPRITSRVFALHRWSYSRLPRMPQATINHAHKTAAAQHSVTVIPAGAAFERFETAADCNPVGVSLRAPDGEHPRFRSFPAPAPQFPHTACRSAAGTYLTSCCVFEALTSHSVLGNPYRLPGMSDEEACALQHCAHDAKL